MKKIGLYLLLSFLTINAFAQAKTTPKNTKKLPAKTVPKAKDALKTDPKVKKTAAIDTVKPSPFVAHIAYVMSKEVNVRKAADTKSELLVQLAAGSEVVVTSRSKTKFTLSGVTANWYKVRFKKDTAEVKGYIWGGYLSDLNADSKKDKDVQFLLRQDDDKHITAQAVRNGELLHTVSAEVPCVAYKIRNNAGTGDVHDAIVVSGKCATSKAETLLIWDGKKISFADNAITKSKNGDDPFHEEKFIIEGDAGAKKGTIIKLATDKIEWDGALYRNSSSSSELFEWTGAALEEVK